MANAPTKREILRARRRWCLQLAEHLEKQFGLERTAYDVDKARKLIDAFLPFSYDEYLAECEEMKDEIGAEEMKPQKPSTLDRMRAAMGLTDKRINLGELLKAVCERLEAAAAMEKRLSRAVRKREKR